MPSINSPQDLSPAATFSSASDESSLSTAQPASSSLAVPPAEGNWASRSLNVLDALFEPLSNVKRHLSDQNTLNASDSANASKKAIGAALHSPGTPTASKELVQRRPSAAQAAFSRFSSIFGLGDSEAKEKAKEESGGSKPQTQQQEPTTPTPNASAAPTWNEEVSVATAAETLIEPPPLKKADDEVLAARTSTPNNVQQQPASAQQQNSIPRRGSRLDFEFPFEFKRLMPDSFRTFQMPDLPALPKLPSMPNLMPALPELEFPAMPDLPQLPDLPDVSHSISAPLQVLNKLHHNISSSIFVSNPHSLAVLANLFLIL